MKFLAVGNITKDLVRTKHDEKYCFGGTSYCGITAARLGYESEILSRGNSSSIRFWDWIGYLNDNGVCVTMQYDKNLTYFVNDYTSGERQQLLLNHTQKIKFRGTKERNVIHINPMFQEVDAELVANARGKCDVLSLDVQGLVRDMKDTHVIGRFWDKREGFLPYLDILKVGKQEVDLVSHLRDYRKICEELNSLGAKVVAITFGDKGSLVYDGEFYEVPIFQTEVVDETGAGDVYATAFALRYFEKRDAFDSALFATAAASFVVENFGAISIGKREDVEERYCFLKQHSK